MISTQLCSQSECIALHHDDCFEKLKLPKLKLQNHSYSEQIKVKVNEAVLKQQNSITLCL